ncbi:MAG TPA: YceI family protein [Myxococcales bacterium]|nr:YceI family protein [Myxococcales bacterium]
MTIITLVIGCAKDPSDGVQKVKIISAAKNIKLPPQKPTAAKPAKPTAEKPARPTAAKATKVKLAGNIRFTGSKVTGSHFCDLKNSGGSLTLNGNDVTTGSFSFEAETGKLHCDKGARNDWTPKLEGHLAGTDFFWSEKYPKATFVSKSIVAKASPKSTHEITGDLTLRGVTRTIVFAATIKADAKKVSGAVEFSINRKDFGIEYTNKADDLIRDNVVLKVELSGTR